MHIHYDPDEYETVSDHRVCAYHKAHPGEAWAGCTCSFSIGSRKRSPEDYARIRAERIKREEDDILAKAAIIQARRAALHQESK